MTVKRANVLTDRDILDTLIYVKAHSKQPGRDELLILLTCYAGLRIGEACTLHFIDFMDTRGNVREYLYVSSRGAKNGKPRTVPLRQEVRDALERYLEGLREMGIKAFGNRPIFKTLHGKALTSLAARQQVRAIYYAVGLQGRSSHSGRRTFTTRAIKASAAMGTSIKDVQELLGHANVDTTFIYVDPSPQIADLVAYLRG